MGMKGICIFLLITLYVLFGCSSIEESSGTSLTERGVSVPGYYDEHLKTKEIEINKAIQASLQNFDSFIFFTDAHWGNNEQNSPALINHIINNTPVEDVIFGGDVITTSYDYPLEAIELGKIFRQSFDSLNCNMFYIYGNHDNNSDGHPKETDRHLTDEQVFNYLQRGMSDCVYGGYFSFYFDREYSKTRFICLDTGRYYYSQLRGNTIETVKFLTNALRSTPEGWHIILLSHIWCFLDTKTTPGRPYLPTYIKSIIKILDDYNTKIEGVFKYDGKSVEYDFTQCTSNIICCIGGHCHLDAILSSEHGIPIIITTADANENKTNTGTIREQAVSVFVIDYTNSVIKMIRIGRGEDLALPLK